MTIPDVPDPNADLADIRQHWLAFCSHDTGLPYPCICPTEDHRPVIAALVGEVETLRAEAARLGELVGDEDYDQERWATCSRAEAIRQANDFHAGQLKWIREHDARRDQRDGARAERDEALRMLLKEQRDQSNRWLPVRDERDQLRADVAQLTADRDSLIKAGEALAADRNEARTKLARCREDRDEYGGQAAEAEKDAEQLGRRLAEVLIERDEAQALLRLAPHHQQQVVTLEYELAQARAELKQLKGERILSVVFGHHKGAPRPFALYRRDGYAPRDHNRVALGAEFDDGAVALRLVDNGGWSTVSTGGAESFAANDCLVIWLSDELEPLAAMETERDEARAEVMRLTAQRDEALTAACRAGATLISAVDQMPPSTPPSTPESDGQGEVAVTDAVEAPGGAEGEPSRMDCAERCEVPAGVRLLESPPSRHAWSDVVRCPNDGCEKTFLVIRNERPHDA